MVVTIRPSTISGTINAPASKSSMQRGCAAGLLHNGQTIISNAGKSNDDLAALEVIKILGATITETGNGLAIDSKGVQPVNNEMNCGESGLGIRMFAPIAALSSKQIVINGKGSLLTRPMDFFDGIFPKLGVDIQSNYGKLPITIKGPLQPKDITIDGSMSSQFLTGLLMAYGSATTVPVTITVNNLKSRPYINLTLQVMQHFGYDVSNNDYHSFLIKRKPAVSKTINYTVEGDWSGGAFLLVAGAIAGKISVQGLSTSSTQADKAVLQALEDCGCTINIEPAQIDIAPPADGTGGLKPFQFDATDCPDLFPPLVTLAAYCNGLTVIKGVNRLAFKESDRGLTLQEEFGKMGVKIILQGNTMLVHGGKPVNGATVSSHHDHRIAMACAVAGLNAGGNTIIGGASAVDKSYPDFFKHLKAINAGVDF